MEECPVILPRRHDRQAPNRTHGRTTDATAVMLLRVRAQANGNRNGVRASLKSSRAPGLTVCRRRHCQEKPKLLSAAGDRGCDAEAISSLSYDRPFLRKAALTADNTHSHFLDPLHHCHGFLPFIRQFGDSFARRIRHRNDQGHDSRTSFHITPEDRPSMVQVEARLAINGAARVTSTMPTMTQSPPVCASVLRDFICERSRSRSRKFVVSNVSLDGGRPLNQRREARPGILRIGCTQIRPDEPGRRHNLRGPIRSVPSTSERWLLRCSRARRVARRSPFPRDSSRTTGSCRSRDERRHSTARPYACPLVGESP
jgi:hypothetical protein